MTDSVRVRFAPSPTGPLHIGGIRTALYNYLFSRRSNGTFILRIEDTDQNRFVEGTEKYISEALQWCGIIPDEGPGYGGEYGPYRQSERKSIYKDYALQLIEKSNAYYAFDTPEELDQMREKLKAAKVSALHYNTITRTKMRNSLTLSKGEVKELLDSGQPYVIRMKVPPKEEIRFKDLIRGWVMVQSSTLDDKIIMKSDGMPTYHLANIVDDHLMKISHVIRGEEWLPSAPLHVLLYRLLGWEESQPEFAHLPLLLKPNGIGKLSKRDSEKHGYPIFPLEWNDSQTGEKLLGFREEGYLKEAFVNFMALLGWNPGGEQEIFSMNELINLFSLGRIGKSGAKFDIEKAKWFNQQYLKAKPDKELAQYLIQSLKADNISCNQEKAIGISRLLKERITFIHELKEKGLFFFVAPQNYDEDMVNKKWHKAAVEVLEVYKQAIAQLETFSYKNLHAKLEEVLEKAEQKPGVLMPVLRLSLTGSGSGPDLMGIMETLGREETVNRINHAISKLSDKIKVP